MAETDTSSENANLVAPEGVSSQVWTMAAIAALIGVGLASIAMWRTTVSAKRSREIRKNKRKDPSSFLEQIEQTHDEHREHGDDTVRDETVRDETREN